METASPAVAAEPRVIMSQSEDRADRLQRVFRATGGSLHRFILLRVGGRHDLADDLLQQTCCVAAGHRRMPDTDEACTAWLYGIARNVIRKHWRASRKRSETTIDPNASALKLVETMEAGPIRDDELTKDETATLLLSAINALPQADQQLVFDFYFDRRSQADLAKQLGVPVKGVESKLYRIRKRLRNTLRG